MVWYLPPARVRAQRENFPNEIQHKFLLFNALTRHKLTFYSYLVTVEL